MTKRTSPPYPHEPTKTTRDTVLMHMAVGTPQALIADILGIAHTTLTKHYHKEINEGLAKANAEIGGALFNKAKDGDVACMIFWLKTRAKWREKDDEKLDTDKKIIIEFKRATKEDGLA